MSDWIDINLPWHYIPFIDRIEVFDDSIVQARGRNRFGKTYRESSDAIPDKLWKEYHDLEDSLGDEERHYSNEELRAEMYKHEQFTSIKEHREFAKVWEAWYDQQPEIIERDRLDVIARDENNKKSFCGRGLNKPGTLIEYEEDGKTHQELIGSINCLAGVCDDCRAFDSAVIKRYKVVYDMDTSK